MWACGVTTNTQGHDLDALKEDGRGNSMDDNLDDILSDAFLVARLADVLYTLGDWMFNTLMNSK